MACIVSYKEDSHFPIENLPYGVFSTKDNSKPRIGVAIGDKILDLYAVSQKTSWLQEAAPELKDAAHIFGQATLNHFMSLGKSTWSATRCTIRELLTAGSPLAQNKEPGTFLVPQNDATMHLPVTINDYTDFYASKEHATNVGIMFRGKENALMPNWLHLPVGYHGRASSVVVSGTEIRRPCGQRIVTKGQPPEYGPCLRLDIELEVAVLVGVGNELGTRIPISKTDEHLFGMVIMNDWSARDIQAWEYQPLGPFLGKSFATTISPWVVTFEALDEFSCMQPEQIPKPLEYLQDSRLGAYGVELEANIRPANSDVSTTMIKTNLKYMYWTFHQQLAHHSVNGCNMRTGDLLGSGTISGPTESSYGSMLELCWAGQKEILLADNQSRKFLLDGDEVSLTGWCQGKGYRVGFGECKGKILPSIP